MRNSLGISAGLLAMVALAVRLGVPGAPETRGNAENAGGRVTAAQEKAAAKGDSGKAPFEGPWLATRYFYGDHSDHGDHQVQPASEEEKPSLADRILDCDLATIKATNCADDESSLKSYFGIQDEEAGDIRFLIAIVPDPLHTRLSLFTDSSVSAIQRAAADKGWRFATQWLPWSDTVDPTEKDPEKRRTQRAVIREQERQPGLMVFRRQMNCPYSGNYGPCRFDPAVLMVFLIGETPTAGVNPVQFQMARAYMRAIHSSSIFRVNGPTFSGSFDSLNRLISMKERDDLPKISYDIVSGTATYVRGGWAIAAAPNASFRSAATAGSFPAALSILNIPRSEAAVLAEDESAYGENALARGDDDTIRKFRFPRDISHLRNAYRETTRNSGANGAPAPDLDFSLKDNDVGEDSIPDFSHAQTPLSQNAVLDEIAETIQRDRIRIVQILATNVLDMLFVSRVVKQRCPDTRILLAYPDLLFVEAAQTDSLTGVLALSPFPLFMEANEWSGPERRELPFSFPNSNAEGVYRATSFLLDGLEQGDFHPGFPDLAAPFWLLTLDRGGFLPVGLVRGDHLSGTLNADADVVPEIPAPSGVWIFAAGTTAILCVAFTFWICFLGFCKKPSYAAMFAIEDCGDGSEGTSNTDEWRIFYIFVCAVALCAIAWVLGVPGLRSDHVPLWVKRLFWASTIGCCGLVAAFALWFGGEHNTGGQRLLRLLAALVAMPLLGGAWWAICANNGEGSLFFSFRAAELRLGSSPAIPVIACLGIVLAFAVFHLSRLYAVVSERPDVMVEPEEISTTLQDRLKCFCGNMNDSLAAPFILSGWRWLWVLIPAAALFFLTHFALRLSAIDGGLYDVVSIGLVVIAVLALMLTAWQVLTLWHSLHGFLACLDVLPFAGRFTRPDHSSSVRPIWVRSLNIQSLPIHAAALVVLNDLTIRAPECRDVDQWKQNIEAYRERLGALLSADRRAKVLALRREMRTLGKAAAVQVFSLALSVWRQVPLVQGPAEPASREQSEDADRTAGLISINGNPENPLHLAETFIALHYSPFLLYCVRQIRNLILFLSIGLLLLVVALNSYSHQAPQFIGRFLFVLLVCTSWIVVRCLVGIERDPILSRIAGTTPGKVGFEGWLKLLSYGALPVLSLLASQFPVISNFLYSWVAPTLQAFR